MPIQSRKREFNDKWKKGLIGNQNSAIKRLSFNWSLRFSHHQLAEKNGSNTGALSSLKYSRPSDFIEHREWCTQEKQASRPRPSRKGPTWTSINAIIVILCPIEVVRLAGPRRPHSLRARHSNSIINSRLMYEKSLRWWNARNGSWIRPIPGNPFESFA